MVSIFAVLIHGNYITKIKNYIKSSFVINLFLSKFEYTELISLSMKNINFKILTGVLFLTVASLSCSKHCDDEDYIRDAESKTAITSDSLKVASTQHSENVK